MDRRLGELKGHAGLCSRFIPAYSRHRTHGHRSVVFFRPGCWAVRIGNIGFSLYWMLFGVTCATLGYSSIQIGILARVLHGLRPRFVKRVQKFLTYDRGMLVSGGLMVVGLILLGSLVYHYLKLGLTLKVISHPAILGLLLVILGFQTFCFTLLMEMAKRVTSISRQ